MYNTLYVIYIYISYSYYQNVIKTNSHPYKPPITINSQFIIKINIDIILTHID